MKDNSHADAVRSTRPTRVHYVVLAALCVITTINYVQRNSFGGAEKQIRTELHFGMVQIRVTEGEREASDFVGLEKQGASAPPRLQLPP